MIATPSIAISKNFSLKSWQRRYTDATAELLEFAFWLESQSRELPKKEFKNLIEKFGFVSREANKYTKFAKNFRSSSAQELSGVGLSMLFSLSAPRYEELRREIPNMEVINQQTIEAKKKELYPPKPRQKKESMGGEFKMVGNQPGGVGKARFEVWDDSGKVTTEIQKRLDEEGITFGHLLKEWLERDRREREGDEEQSISEEGIAEETPIEEETVTQILEELQTEVVEKAIAPSPEPQAQEETEFWRWAKNLNPVDLKVMSRKFENCWIRCDILPLEEQLRMSNERLNRAKNVLAELEALVRSNPEQMHALGTAGALETNREAIAFEEAYQLKIKAIPQQHTEEPLLIQDDADISIQSASDSHDSSHDSEKDLRLANDKADFCEKIAFQIAELKSLQRIFNDRNRQGMIESIEKKLHANRTSLHAFVREKGLQDKFDLELFNQRTNVESKIQSGTDLLRQALAFPSAKAWKSVELVAHRDNKILAKLSAGLSKEEKAKFIPCLISYLEANPEAIALGELNWLAPESLMKILPSLEFDVTLMAGFKKEACAWIKVEGYGTQDELWFFEDVEGNILKPVVRSQFEVRPCKF